MTTSFSIQRKIGEGGMGVVYLAIQHPLEREVAIKFLPPELSDQMRIERFEREVEAAMRLHHPNVVKILDKGNQGGKYYYVMEYLDGYSTLHDFIQQRGRLPWKEAVEILVQVLDALECCHERDLFHRDIKPRNIMVSETRPVKVMDFGLVKLLDAEALTQAGKSMGTPSYMAPERFLGKPETASIDLFSAGCVLYEMLSGRRAFPGDSAREVVPRILREATPSLGEIDPALAAYQPILETFLAKYPEERFATARAARDALERRLVSGVVSVFPPRRERRTQLSPIETAKHGSPPAVDPALQTRKMRRHKRRRRVTQIMATCVTGSLLLLLIHLAMRPSPDPAPPLPPVELAVEAGVDRARVSMTTALTEPLEIEVSSDKDPRGVRRTIRDELTITDLVEDTKYHFQVSRPGSAPSASGHFRTLSILEAARDLVTALEGADLPALRRRIQRRKVELAPGGNMTNWKGFREEAAKWVQQAMIKSRLAPLVETFSPVRARFFDSAADPEEKRRLYVALQPLAALEYDAAIYEVPMAALARKVLAPSWDTTEAGDLSRAPGVALVWDEGLPFEQVQARLSKDLTVIHTREGPARFHTARRTLRTDPGNFTKEMTLVEVEARGDTPWESSDPVAFPAGGKAGRVVTAFEGATGGNVLEVEFAEGTGPFQSFACLRPRSRDFHQVAHAFDARLLAGRRLRLRCRFQVDPHAPGFAQRPQIHYLLVVFPP